MTTTYFKASASGRGRRERGMRELGAIGVLRNQLQKKLAEFVRSIYSRDRRQCRHEINKVLFRALARAAPW